MITKTIFRCVCGFMVAVVFTACNETSIEGKWIEPVPGMENQVQGINLEKNGKASSINMATLEYTTWEKNGDELILSGKSIGNGQTISFSDTLVIESLTDDKLDLRRGSLTISYQKQ